MNEALSTVLFPFLFKLELKTQQGATYQHCSQGLLVYLAVPWRCSPIKCSGSSRKRTGHQLLPNKYRVSSRFRLGISAKISASIIRSSVRLGFKGNFVNWFQKSFQITLTLVEDVFCWIWVFTADRSEMRRYVCV